MDIVSYDSSVKYVIIGIGSNLLILPLLGNISTVKLANLPDKIVVSLGNTEEFS